MTTSVRFRPTQTRHAVKRIGACALAAALLMFLLPFVAAPPAQALMSSGTVEFVGDGTYTIPENVAFSGLFVQRTGGDNGPISVLVETSDGSATAGTDYISIATTVTWADGESGVLPVPLTITDDSLAEPPTETFTVTLSASDPSVIGSFAVATMTIIDDDGSGTIGWQSSGVGFGEAVSASKTITLKRSHGSVGPIEVTVDFIEGSALDGFDYASTSTTVHWADGDTAPKPIPIVVVDDSFPESDEVFTAVITATNPAVVGPNSTLPITIIDNDGPGEVSFGFSSETVREDAGTVTLNLGRRESSVSIVSVSAATADGSAIAGLDYTASSTVVSWPDGDMSGRSVIIPILDDALMEGPETFTVTVTSLGSVAIGANATMTVTITDDDTVAYCDGKVVTINMANGDAGTGTSGDDVILGTDNADAIDGGGGNDTICGEGGSDAIEGGPGNDFIYGGPGDDTLTGGDGNDRIRGQQDVDTIDGEAGHDFLYGGTGNDTINGGGGDDTIGGFGGADMIFAGPGNDTVFGGFGADTINGGGGDDVLRGLIGNDLIHGNAGNDEVYGDNGLDELYGDNGNDDLFGGNSVDAVFGGPGDDSVNGGKSDDALSGGDGFDVCAGNRGTDTATTTCENTFGIP